MIEITEIKKHISLSVDFDVTVLQPHLDWASKNFIPDLLGTDLYNKLIAYLAAPTDIAIVPLIRRPYFVTLNTNVNEVIIQIAMFDWLSIAGVSISETGLQRIEGEISGLTRKSAYQYQEKNAKEYFRNKGFNAMDAVLDDIINNILQFPEFKTSQNYLDLTGNIVPNAFTFSNGYNINRSKLLFIKLKQFIREAELFDIVPSIGTDFYNYIKIHLTDVDIVAILPELRSAIACKAIARGIESTSINIAEDGARLIVRASSRDNMEVTSLPDLKAVSDKAHKTGDSYIGMLCRNIRANIAKYPLYVDARLQQLDISQNKMIPLF